MPVAFITGAGGFIGGYAVREFLGQGWRVRALVHRTLPPALAALPGVEVARGDITDRAALEAALGDGVPDVIVHCAGRASDVGRWEAFRRANLLSVQHLGAMALARGVGRLVFVSTTDVYGLRDFHGEAEDELPYDPRPRNPYPACKIAAERWLREALPPERWSIIRPAAVWGVGDRTLAPRMVAFLRSSPWIVHFGHWRGRNRWPLAHVRNVAAALFLAATRPAAGGRALNVLDDEWTTVDDWYRLLASVYLPGRRFRAITLPAWTGLAVGAVITGISTLLNLEHPLADPSHYAVRTVSSHLDFSNRALHALCDANGRALVTRAEGVRELREAVGGRC